MNHTCTNANPPSGADGFSLSPCQACQSEFMSDPVGFIFSRTGRFPDEFTRGRDFERWLKQQDELAHSSCGRDGDGYPETDAELAESFRRYQESR